MLRLAVLQTPGELDGKRARLDWLRTSLEKMADAKADLVLLPELYACGYNIGDALIERAEPIDGALFAEMKRIAIEFGVSIHFGFAERSGETLYNSALCVSSNGQLLCHQRKLAIPPGFERKYFTPGQGCTLFELNGVKIASLICYDAEFPETVRHVAALGAQLVLVPTALSANWAWVAETMIPTRAFENGVYLAYANSCGEENGLEYLGGSVIAAPDGEILARAGHKPMNLFADVEARRVVNAQERLPYIKEFTAFRF